jgi:hypothetical protein
MNGNSSKDTVSIEEEQKALCKAWAAPFAPVGGELKLGIAENVKSGALPIHGLRHPSDGDTTGWYIWAGGEPSDAPDFFKPLHVSHLDEWCPGIKRFLGLAPGWRFLTDMAGHDDVWEDPSLLKLD